MDDQAEPEPVPVSAVPASVPNADPYSPEAWASEPYEKRIQVATLFIAHAKDSFELARKQMALGMGLMDGCLMETMEAMGIAQGTSAETGTEEES